MSAEKTRARRWKRVAAFLCSVMLIVASIVPAMASTAHVTFTNVESNQPDLFITKSVSSAVEGYSVPEDAEFTFTLKWDLDKDGTLEYASNEKYTVYGADGSEVYNYDSTGTKVSFKTSAEGTFTLKAGQTAKFEWVGTGVEYEITESTQDHWTQVVPTGEQAATGTADATGTTVTFENVYVPETDIPYEDIPEGDVLTTGIEIRKDMAWPDAYEMPDFSDLEFTFEVVVDDEALAGYSYTIYDTSTGAELSSGTTDEDGRLSFSAGQYAIIEDVPVDMDYAVTEVSTEGWEAVGETTEEGATVYPIVYSYFTNRTASFVVTKTVDSDVEEYYGEEFTFYVTDENGDAFTGLSYYLYDSDDELVTDEPLTVSDDGSFTLTHGQKALFVGIAEGTVYNVTEEAVKGYTTTPEDGYTDMEVSDTLQTLDFVNSVNPEGSITITKKDADGNVLPGVTFELQLPDGTVVDTQTTDDAGVVSFTGLESGDYNIYETSTVGGYSLLAERLEVTIPLVLTKEEVKELGNVDTSNAVYLKAEGAYYFYDLSYEVTNTAQLDLPQAGMFGTVFPYAAAGCIVAVAGIALYAVKKRHDFKKEVKP